MIDFEEEEVLTEEEIQIIEQRIHATRTKKRKEIMNLLSGTTEEKTSIENLIKIKSSEIKDQYKTVEKAMKRFEKSQAENDKAEWLFTMSVYLNIWQSQKKLLQFLNDEIISCLPDDYEVDPGDEDAKLSEIVSSFK